MMRDRFLHVGGRTWYLGHARGVHIRPCEADDEHAFTPRADFAADLAADEGKLPDGPKWTLCDGDRIIGIAGITGSGKSPGDRRYAWALLADLTARQFVTGAQIAAAVLQSEAEAGPVWCVPTDDPAHAAGARRLLERMGFKFAYRRGLDFYRLEAA